MVTNCYLLDNNKQTKAAISRLVECIPCFINTKEVSVTRFELYIKCRAEDVVTIERVLAPYV